MRTDVIGIAENPERLLVLVPVFTLAAVDGSSARPRERQEKNETGNPKTRHRRCSKKKGCRLPDRRRVTNEDQGIAAPGIQQPRDDSEIEAVFMVTLRGQPAIYMNKNSLATTARFFIDRCRVNNQLTLYWTIRIKRAVPIWRQSDRSFSSTKTKDLTIMSNRRGQKTFRMLFLGTVTQATKGAAAWYGSDGGDPPFAKEYPF